MSSTRVLLARALAVCLVLAGLFATSAEAEDRAELQISAVNGTYRDLDGALAPVEQGPVTIVLRSPSHELVVHGNRLALERAEGGDVNAVFEADVEGWGNLELELRTAAGVTPMRDRVEAGRQWLRAEGKIRLEHESGGYGLTLVEAFRPTVGIQIRSEVARQMVDSCRTLRAFPMFAVLDCDALSARLGRVEIPMPEPGTRYHVPAALLSPAERVVFDRFVLPAEKRLGAVDGERPP
ncbi:MAG: hypothetical protein MI919_04735 [Holophagales bacterium]|nr:hypothetical protein [Holophagales bacterium]